MSKKTCLVTGSAGFIGSHLCERLVKEGHDVLGIDDLSTGRASNMESFIRSPNFLFVKNDLAFKKIGALEQDWVFHLAALADIVPSIKDPDAYHRANVDGTVNLLEGMRRGGKAKLIYAASSSCYGIPDQYPTTEATPCRPKYPYAFTKYIGEQYVMHWAKVYGVSAVSLRLFNVYGPRARTSGNYGAVFGVFLAQLANNQPLTVVGDGNQKRDFTYVSDVVDAFIRAADSDVRDEIFNVASSKPQSVNYLVDLLSPTSIEHLPERPGEPQQTWGNTWKIRDLLHWEPKVSFEEGVKIMKAHLDEYKSAPLWTKDSIAEATKDWFTHLS